MRDERGGQCGTQVGMSLGISLLYRSIYSSGWAGLGIQQQSSSLALQGKKSKRPRNKRNPTINFASTSPHSCTAKARYEIMTSRIWTHNSSVECAGLGFISHRRMASTLYVHIYVSIRAYHDNIPTIEQSVFEELGPIVTTFWHLSSRFSRNFVMHWCSSQGRFSQIWLLTSYEVQKFSHPSTFLAFYCKPNMKFWQEFSFTFSYVDWNQCFFSFPTCQVWFGHSHLFEKDGPYLSDFIFQNTHFFTYDLLPPHTLKKKLPRVFMLSERYWESQKVPNRGHSLTQKP